MRFSLFAIAGALGLAQASVPADLASGFDASLQLDVAFSKDVSSGSQDSMHYDQSRSMYQPSYGLRDYSSHVRSEDKFVIIVVDTSDSSKRYMHYVHQDYQYSKDKYVMASQSAPYMGYWAPGYLGESGRGKTYTHLMYKQPDNFQVKSLPKLGDEVSMKDFVKGCGLDKAVAGITVVVDIDSSSKDYQSYRSKTNNNGGYGSYWNYMPKYNSYNMGYNQQTQYGNQYQQGWNQYQYMGSDKGGYSTTVESYAAPSTYYPPQAYQQPSTAYQASPAPTGVSPSSPSSGSSQGGSQGGSPNDSGNQVPASQPTPPFPTTAAASFTTSGAAGPTGGSPVGAATSPSSSPLVGAGSTLRERAWGSVAAALGVAGFAVMFL